jgi:hypothetical protein
MARPISDLTKFILSRPSGMSVADVIAAAGARGLSASQSNVHRVRASFEMAADGTVVKKGALKKNRAARAPKAAPEKAAPVKAVAKATPAAVAVKTAIPKTKTDYVRGLADMKPAAIVEQGKRDGVKLSLAYVYNIRRDSKRAGTSSAPAATIVKRGSSARAVHALSAPTAVYGPGPDGTEKTMRAAVLAVVLEHGLDRARGVVDAVVAKLRAVVELS